MNDKTFPWWRPDFDRLDAAIAEIARLDRLAVTSRRIFEPINGITIDYAGLTAGEYDRRRELLGITIPFAVKRLLYGAEIRPKASLLMKDGTVVR